MHCITPGARLGSTARRLTSACRPWAIRLEVMKKAVEKRRREGEEVTGVYAAEAAVRAQAQSQRSGLDSEAPVRIQGFVVTDHWLTVPLDHFSESSEEGPTIRVFAREVRGCRQHAAHPSAALMITCHP